jgi:hypothetical protein
VKGHGICNIDSCSGKYITRAACKTRFFIVDASKNREPESRFSVTPDQFTETQFRSLHWDPDV